MDGHATKVDLYVLNSQLVCLDTGRLRARAAVQTSNSNSNSNRWAQRKTLFREIRQVQKPPNYTTENLFCIASDAIETQTNTTKTKLLSCLF